MAVDEDELVECRLCGRRWRSLGHHLRGAHGLSANEYRDLFGIRRGTPLTSPATRARIAAVIGSVIAAGGLDAHYAGNRERASVAAAASVIVTRRLRAEGVLPSTGGSPRIPREKLEAIVAAVVAGATKTAAVAAAGVSWSAAHVALGRHPDLAVRLEEAKRRRRGIDGPDTVSRETARSRGLKRYRTGLPCRRGHLAERLASDASCVECARCARLANR